MSGHVKNNNFAISTKISVFLKQSFRPLFFLQIFINESIPHRCLCIVTVSSSIWFHAFTIWRYILLRSVEYCGTSSAPGISSHQLPKFLPSNSTYSWNQFPSIPSILGISSDSALTQIPNFGPESVPTRARRLQDFWTRTRTRTRYFFTCLIFENFF